jgi:hypothetical protein
LAEAPALLTHEEAQYRICQGASAVGGVALGVSRSGTGTPFASLNANDYHSCQLSSTGEHVKQSAALIAWLVVVVGPFARAADVPEFQLVIKDHSYQPAALNVPADTKFKLIVKNEDATPEEFESTDFNRETVVLPNHTVVIYVGPLRAGNYGFFGDFHRETAQGRLIVQ